MKFGAVSVFSANLIWLCYFDLMEFCHLGASAKALSPCPLQCTLSGAHAAESRRIRAGGVCSPPDMWVFEQGASLSALSLCVHAESNASHGHVFGCWLAGWVCVRECGFIRRWDTRRSQGARTTDHMHTRTRGWNLYLCNWWQWESQREKCKVWLWH